MCVIIILICRQYAWNSSVIHTDLQSWKTYQFNWSTFDLFLARSCKKGGRHSTSFIGRKDQEKENTNLILYKVVPKKELYLSPRTTNTAAVHVPTLLHDYLCVSQLQVMWKLSVPVSLIPTSWDILYLCFIECYVKGFSFRSRNAPLVSLKSRIQAHCWDRGP